MARTRTTATVSESAIPLKPSRATIAGAARRPDISPPPKRRGGLKPKQAPRLPVPDNVHQWAMKCATLPDGTFNPNYYARMIAAPRYRSTKRIGEQGDPPFYKEYADKSYLYFTETEATVFKAICQQLPQDRSPYARIDAWVTRDAVRQASCMRPNSLGRIGKAMDSLAEPDHGVRLLLRRSYAGEFGSHRWELVWRPYECGKATKESNEAKVAAVGREVRAAVHQENVQTQVEYLKGVVDDATVAERRRQSHRRVAKQVGLPPVLVERIDKAARRPETHSRDKQTEAAPGGRQRSNPEKASQTLTADEVIAFWSGQVEWARRRRDKKTEREALEALETAKRAARTAADSSDEAAPAGPLPVNDRATQQMWAATDEGANLSATLADLVKAKSLAAPVTAPPKDTRNIHVPIKCDACGAKVYDYGRGDVWNEADGKRHICNVVPIQP